MYNNSGRVKTLINRFFNKNLIEFVTSWRAQNEQDLKRWNRLYETTKNEVYNEKIKMCEGFEEAMSIIYVLLTQNRCRYGKTFGIFKK